MKKGQIGVTTENIFPIIKKFLYSDQDIFLREIISNATDALSKLQAIAEKDSEIGELGQLAVYVALDQEAKTLSVTDTGIGMTEEELDRYINQIAFSGAEDFLKKYEGADASIIGHFGLGFYSSFMVSHQVEIDTLSYKKDAQAVHWSCDGSPDYQMGPSQRTTRGTTITMHIDEEHAHFLEKSTIEQLLYKYCRFLPFPVYFGKKEEWKDGKMQPTDEDNCINEVAPLWTKKPSEVTDEEYNEFYQTLFPGNAQPLFRIHLNVDYPFKLQGILYFPELKEGVIPQKNSISLYCNKVFVTDELEGVLPEWLKLMHGIIDSPDIPLNVSRSYLQKDPSAQKISSHISKKVADKLEELFRSDRTAYEQKWRTLEFFVHYGMITDEKAYERLKPALLFKDCDGKRFYTLEELKTLTAASQTNKDGVLVELYATDATTQYLPCKQATDKGYVVLLMDSYLALPFINHLEEKEEKLHFTRVDSDSIDNLIGGKDTAQASSEETKPLEALFQNTIPDVDKAHFIVEVAASANSNAAPTELVQDEWMRRMKDMSQFREGSDFYSELPDSYRLIINPNNPIVAQLSEALHSEELKQAFSELAAAEKAHADWFDANRQKKEDEMTDEEKQERTRLNNEKNEKQDAVNVLLQKFAEAHTEVSQLWDLALLSRSLLSGERLANFIRRSTGLLNK